MGEAGERKVYLTISRGETAGKVFLLQPGANLIGRWDPDCGAFPEVDLEIHDPEAKVSRRHAVVTLEGGKIEIEDIGSMNGTFINRGKRLVQGVRHELFHNDEVVIGKTFLSLSVEPAKSDNR